MHSLSVRLRFFLDSCKFGEFAKMAVQWLLYLCVIRSVMIFNSEHLWDSLEVTCIRGHTWAVMVFVCGCSFTKCDDQICCTCFSQWYFIVDLCVICNMPEIFCSVYTFWCHFFYEQTNMARFMSSYWNLSRKDIKQQWQGICQLSREWNLFVLWAENYSRFRPSEWNLSVMDIKQSDFSTVQYVHWVNYVATV